MGEWINKMTKVSIEFENHIVNGCCEFTEWDGWVDHIICFWSEVTSVEPANTDAGFMSRALAAVKDAAYEEHVGRHCNPFWSQLPRNAYADGSDGYP